MRAKWRTGNHGYKRAPVSGTESIGLNSTSPATVTRVASSTATADPSDRPARITRVGGTRRFLRQICVSALRIRVDSLFGWFASVSAEAPVIERQHSVTE